MDRAPKAWSCRLVHQGRLPLRRHVARDKPESAGIHCHCYAEIDRDLVGLLVDAGNLADKLDFLTMAYLRRSVHDRMRLAIGGHRHAYPIFGDPSAHFGRDRYLVANAERALRHQKSLERVAA